MLADEQAPSGSHLFDTRQELRRAAGLSSLDSAGAVAPRHQVCAYLGFSRCVAAGEEPVRGTVAEHAAELTRQTDHVLVDWLALVYARQLTPSPTSNQVSTFSRSAMLFRASDPGVASLETQGTRKVALQPFLQAMLDLNAQLGRATDLQQLQALFDAAKSEKDGMIDLRKFLSNPRAVSYFVNAPAQG